MQKIKYRAAEKKWDFKSGYGNHRIIVDSPKGEYVRAVLPWRRRDLNPEKIGVRVCFTPSGDVSETGIGKIEIKDVYIEKSSRDEGVIIFRAPEAGAYEIYYMPFEMPGHWYDPKVFYFEPSQMTADPEWTSKITSSEIETGTAVYYESRTDFDSFYPMEIPMTSEERGKLIKGLPFVAVTESRIRSVRMKNELPMIWCDRSEDELTVLHDKVCRNEHYVFQIAVCAEEKLENVKVVFTDINNRAIGSDDCICFNLDGRDADGNIIKIQRDADKGEVLPLWCGLRAENFTGKKIEINAEITADNTDHSAALKIQLDVEQNELPRNGDDDLWRMSRLFWLNSDIGISRETIKPYTPVELSEADDTISILGRRIKVGALGLPSQIESFYNDSCLLYENTEPISLLESPIELITEENGRRVKLFSRSNSWIPQGEIQTTVKSCCGDDALNIDSEITYESDGHIDCMLKITAESDGEYAFTLKLPMRYEAAPYMMGMCREGGKVPAYWEYLWNKDYLGNLVWFGGARAGLQIKLMPEFEGWGRNLPFPKLWYNEGKGGMRMCSSVADGTVTMSAWTGKVKMKKGQSEMLHFHMIVTPFHPVDYNVHWTDHYYHKNSWNSAEPIPSLEHAKEFGTKTVILHQGGPLNENINYPFWLAPKLKEEVDRAHDMGLKYKIYYTVRELSNYTAELWALRALGDEIFYTGTDFHIADFFAKDDDKVRSRPRGGPWLIEHLVEGFTAAWHQFLQNDEYDCAISTQHKSRWHNYYLSGLDWLTRVVGIDGLYLDGIGYDRHIMRRVRRIIEDAKGRCDIDIHCGNEHGITYGYSNSSCIYLEHFAYANNIWNGEGYEYESEDAEYYLTEISGLPFGIMGEMLEQGGNPWRGMLFGMTARCGWSQGGVSRPIWDVWDSFGMTDARMLGFWHPECPVTVENDQVRATAFVKDNGDALIVLASWWPNDRRFLVSLNREMLKIDGDYELYAPEIEGVQNETVFRGGELIPIESGKGWILILRK